MRKALQILATVSFVGYFAFVNLATWYERDSAGILTTIRPDGVYVRATVDGSAAATAGFEAGDRIVAMDRLAIADGIDMRVAVANMPVGTATVWQLERGGVPLTKTVAPLSRHWRRPLAYYVLGFLAFGLSLMLGVLLAWRGPPDTSTRLGAWFLASLGCSVMPLFPNSLAVFWRELPFPVEALLWPAAVSSIFVHVLLFAVCARVPRPILSRAQFAVAVLPGATVAVFVILFSALTVYAPERAVALPVTDWMQFAGPLTYPIYFFASALLVAANVRRATDVTDRRRAQTLLAGVVTGGAGLLLFALLLGLQQTGRRSGGTAVPVLIAITLFCVLPLSFAYAMLRHRLFDLRIIVRLGLQYALARGMIIALVPLAIAALVADVLLHGDQPLRAVLIERGWTYATIAAVTLFAYSQRERWMASLDRRFFRERYAAQQILREVVEDVGRSPDLETAAKTVVARIDSALHPTHVAVMQKPRAADAFTAAAAAPDASAAGSLASASAITAIVRALRRPVVFGTQLKRDLPDADREWLQHADIDLIVPIVTDVSKDEALLVLGPRRSEEPYSQEDLDLLGAIAASLALRQGRSTPDSPTTATMTPRRLGNRYRIEALIGEGGMGVVYAAVDETLGRAVAVKLVREEQLGADGLERFQREARAAASLSHPNIVTVHDYGIDEGGAPYLVMERLLGRSLRSALRSEKRITSDRALGILQGVASAIDAAHKSGMVHRDLKPENIFLVTVTQMMRIAAAQGSNSNFASSNSEIPKVLDFGIAKTTAATSATTSFATAPGALVGTVAYMSPEQLAGGKPAPGWDVWSLGVIAYEMLSGAHPFATAARGAGMPVVRAAAIRSIAPDLPQDADAFFDRALAFEAGYRPATASALAADLRTALATD